MAIRNITTMTGRKMFDAAGLPVVASTLFACGLAAYSGVRCFVMNPDVRRARKALHEPVPGDEVAKAGKIWQKQHDDRHLRNEAGNVGIWNALGMKRVDAVEEYFPGSLARQ